jgi:hypothetical protein
LLVELAVTYTNKLTDLNVLQGKVLRREPGDDCANPKVVKTEGAAGL